MIYLNLLILTISINCLQSWLLENNIFQHKYALKYIQIPWHFLSMPFFYMFLVHYLKINNKLYHILKTVIIIFCLLVFAQLIFVIKIGNSTTSITKLNYIFEKYTTFEEVFSAVTSLSFFIYSSFILFSKGSLLNKIKTYDNLKWLYSYFIFSALGYTLWVIALIVKMYLNYTNFILFYYPLRVFTTVLIFWLGYQGLKNIRISSERKKIRSYLHNKLYVKNTKGIKKPEKRDEKTIQKNNYKQQEQFKKIDTHIRSNNKFLKSKYTLQNLSKETNIGISTLSLIINSYAQRSFTDYINEMRIEQAKHLLIDPSYIEYTITSIGLESGFNSKSTFYTAFKKHTGCTPSQFKKQKTTTSFYKKSV